MHKRRDHSRERSSAHGPEQSDRDDVENDFEDQVEASQVERPALSFMHNRRQSRDREADQSDGG